MSIIDSGGMAKGCAAFFTAVALAVVSSPAAAQPLSLNKAEVLAAHNKLRALVGDPPLRWSDKLATGALQWAKVIAGLNRMQHSGTSAVGENLAVSWAANSSLTSMISMWIKERQYYQRGTFPAVSTTGNWESVAHYTQMVWRRTTEVGCGVADSGRTNFLVCWYNPQGNFVGQIAY